MSELYTFHKNTSAEILRQTIQRVDEAYAPATIRAYQADFIDFISYCDNNHENALPASAEIIASYITHLTNAHRSSASIRRAVSGIATIHTLNEYSNPTMNSTVKLSLRKMHRQLGRFSKQAEGITSAILEDMVAATDQDIRGLRDRAILLVAYDTLCRRSELVAIKIEDISQQIMDRKSGVQSTVLFIRKSKTDQESHGRWLPISAVAAQALNDWLKKSNIKNGLVFRGVNRANKLYEKLNPGQISRIYKKIAKVAKVDPSLIHNISGHSMRVGAAQDLVISGASLPIIMCRGRWSKSDTVMRYVEKVGIPI